MKSFYWTFLFLAISLIFSAIAFSSEIPEIRSENNPINVSNRLATLKEILYSNSMTFDYGSLNVLIDGSQREPRWRMRDARISLSPYVVRDTEFTKLFVHELAHYIDIYIFIPSKKRYDPSDSFYTISWQKPSVKYASAGIMDFVSGYAQTNQYEDFAESFVFYVFHNATFADRALRSESLRQKYLFFANIVFPRGYFQGTDFSIGRVPSYVWDTTKISYSLQKYLYSL